jgi:LacI family transcriptional regulator
VTIHDIAAAAGVSSATASRVVNGVPTVDPALARRVTEAIEAHGYVPNPNARALRRRMSSIWRVIIPDLQNPFFIGVVSAIEEAAGQHASSIVLSNSDEHLDREREAVWSAVAEQAAGVVIACASESKSSVGPLQDAGIPVVLIDRRVRDYSGDAVYIDNRRAGQLAAEHLIARGYQRLACIAGSVDVSATEDRLAGFRAALEAAGGDLPDCLVRRTDRRIDRGEESLRSLMALPSPPDALYVTSEPLTAGVYRAAQDTGMDMPGDLGLVGTDDAAWMSLVRPGVTTISQPVDQIGSLAGEMLARRSRDPEVARGTITLEPSLVERASA